MAYFISFLLTLVFLAAEFIQLQTIDLEEKKDAACSRGPDITAASRTENHTKFYIFEKQHAWLYNAQEKVLEDYIDLSEKLNGETVVLATGGFTCNHSNPSNFHRTTLSTEKTGYDFLDIKDFAHWKTESERGLRKVKDMYQKDRTVYKTEDIITAGTACPEHAPTNTRLNAHLYYKDNKLLLFGPDKICHNKDAEMGVYHPFKLDKLKSTKSSVDALAFEYYTNQKGIGVLFVSEGTLHYWREDDLDSPWSEITLFELFGCTSYAMVSAIIGVSLAVIALILTVTVVVVGVLARRRSPLGRHKTLTTKSSKSRRNTKEKRTEIK